MILLLLSTVKVSLNISSGRTKYILNNFGPDNLGIGLDKLYSYQHNISQKKIELMYAMK